MKLKSNSGNFKPCPEYTGPAVCVDATPTKTVQTQYGPKEKFRFVFEIGETKDDGTPWCVWSAPFTPSYHENSALRPFLRKWMGRELSPAEVEKFDVDELVGRPAHITVIHEHSDGEIYANIALITPDKSAEPLKPSGKFVRMKDRPPKDGAGGQGGGYRRAEPAADTGGDLLATKIHVGKCKGLEVRDLSPEQVGALVANWLPTAKANAKPTADDKRLIAALEYWHTANAAKAVPERHAAAIKAMVGRHKIGGRKLEIGDLKRIVAGADVFSRQSDGTTIAAQYAKHGINLRVANTDRINGWAEILTRFGEPNVGIAEGGTRPTLFIHQRCGRLLETLPTLQHDPNRPEDVLKVDADEDGIGGDDCADALRYLVATKSRTITQRKLRGL